MWASPLAAQPAQELGTQPAPAPPPRVLVLDDPAHPRPGLVATLQIQLADLADVQVKHELSAGSVGERVQAATELGRRDDLLLVVWSDDPIVQPDGSQEAVLYAVGQREGRALLEVVRVPGGGGPDMDRTLAIKVHEVVVELARHAELAATALAANDEPRPAPSAATLRWGSMLQLGLAAAPQLGSQLGQWGGSLSAGPVLGNAAWRGSATLGLSWFPTLEARRGGSSVSLLELAPELVLSAEHRIEPLWLGLHAGVGPSFVDVQGRTPGGHRASASVGSATLRFGGALELPLGAGFGLVLDLDLQGRFVQRTFTVNGQAITKLAGALPVGQIGLTWRNQ
jgi:hypothetical protein